MSNETEIKHDTRQRNIIVIFTILLAVMCLRQVQLIFETINKTKGYLEGMELIYAIPIIQFPAFLHLLYGLISGLFIKKNTWKLIWTEVTLLIITISLFFVQRYVSHNLVNYN